MNRPSIFVSYNRKDSGFTQGLVSDLQQAGALVWVDVEGITAGNFVRAIDEAIAKCEWMVLVLTPHALASEDVKEETYAALHRVKQGLMRGVIPVLAAECAAGTIPPQLDALQRYDAIRNYQGALAGVLRAVGLTPVPTNTESPPTPRTRTANARYTPSRKHSAYRCSFCGKPQDDVERLIAGPGGVYICNECIELCQEIIDEEKAVKPASPPSA